MPDGRPPLVVGASIAGPTTAQTFRADEVCLVAGGEESSFAAAYRRGARLWVC